jgi:hypothetical protein
MGRGAGAGVAGPRPARRCPPRRRRAGPGVRQGGSARRPRLHRAASGRLPAPADRVGDSPHLPPAGLGGKQGPAGSPLRHSRSFARTALPGPPTSGDLTMPRTWCAPSGRSSILGHPGAARLPPQTIGAAALYRE